MLTINVRASSNSSLALGTDNGLPSRIHTQTRAGIVSTVVASSDPRARFIDRSVTVRLRPLLT
jgi:hypothetical protein